MRALITHRDNFGGKSISDLINALDQIDNVEIAAVIADNTTPLEGKIIGSFAHEEIAFGNYSNVDWNAVKPIDTELLLSLAKYEHISKENVKRMTSLELKDYKEYYLDSVRFWNDYLDKNGIDLCFLCSLPHAGYDYIIYGLCKSKSIPILYLNELPKNPSEPDRNYLYISDSLEEPLKHELCSSQDLSGIINRYDFYTQKFNARVPKLSEMNNAVKARSRARAAKKLMQRGSILKVVEKVFAVKKNDILLKEGMGFYEKHSCVPQEREDYILVALHYEPEAAISPLGGIFVDQYLMVQMLSYYVSDKIKIYVKEHPIKGYYRKKEYYQKLLNCRNVRLIKKECSANALVADSLAVATVTGSIGWEALINRKPILTFGHCFYQYAPGAFPIRNNTDCSKALQHIINKETFGDNNLEEFLLKLSKHSFRDNEVYITTKDDCTGFNSIIEEKIKEIYIQNKDTVI